MPSPLRPHDHFGASLVGALGLALIASAVRGQDARSYTPQQVCPPPPCLTPAMPAMPVYPPGTTMPSAPTPAPPSEAPTAPVTTPTAPADLFAAGPAFAGPSETVARSPSMYIDAAIPMTQVRLRFDAAYDDNRPDRAEFFYPKCGCFGGGAPGPPLPETSVNYQEISTYIEAAVNNRFSAFIEIPVRFIDPELNRVSGGLGDINAGFKWAFVAHDDRYLTFQLRTYIPTGDPGAGLGTDHVSLEPALLAYQQLTDRLILFGEFRDWIPIGGTNFAGNIIRYGAGLGYEVYQSSQLRLTPLAEFVGWTVLGGKEFSPTIGTNMGTKDAAGDTIVNVKIGLRLDFGAHSSLAASYGRALTGAVWYKDIGRLEYRLAF
jgi:hypothetical protein